MFDAMSSPSPSSGISPFPALSLIIPTWSFYGLTPDKKKCPPVAWHALEVVVNGLMVLEVGTRWVAYGKVGRGQCSEIPGL